MQGPPTLARLRRSWRFFTRTDRVSHRARWIGWLGLQRQSCPRLRGARSGPLLRPRLRRRLRRRCHPRGSRLRHRRRLLCSRRRSCAARSVRPGPPPAGRVGFFCTWAGHTAASRLGTTALLSCGGFTAGSAPVALASARKAGGVATTVARPSRRFVHVPLTRSWYPMRRCRIRRLPRPVPGCPSTFRRVGSLGCEPCRVRPCPISLREHGTPWPPLRLKRWRLSSRPIGTASSSWGGPSFFSRPHPMAHRSAPSSQSAFAFGAPGNGRLCLCALKRSRASGVVLGMAPRRRHLSVGAALAL